LDQRDGYADGCAGAGDGRRRPVELAGFEQANDDLSGNVALGATTRWAVDVGVA
jgi:hypothetical protein